MFWLLMVAAACLFDPATDTNSSQPYPVWTLERLTMDGRAGVKENLFDGRPMVVAAFATWCEPCASEVPMLNALHREHPSLRIVGVSVDDGPPGKVRSWLAKHAVRYPVYLPTPQVLAGRSALGAADDLPLLAFYRADGTRIRRLIGSTPERLIVRCLDELGITPLRTP